MRIVVIGAGLAGVTAAATLRDEGFGGDVTLLSAEAMEPYGRPPMSKDYLMGKSTFEEALIQERGWYADSGVTLRLSSAALAIDRANKTVTTADGEVPYDKLLLATGSGSRHLTDLDESGLPIAYLRDVGDSDRIREHLREGARIVLIGAGWIGLEVASAARRAGADVTVFEMAELPLLKVLGPEVAHHFAAMHRANGVDLRLATSFSREDLKGADLVVVGIGAVPNVTLAAEAGLDVENGVLVDARLRTTDRDIYAAGDIANHDHPRYGRLRVEHEDTAIHQGALAAGNMMGVEETYRRIPFFYTDQYEMGMEYFGHGSGADTVITKGEWQDGTGTFRAYWIRGGEVTAAMHANDWGASKELRKLVEQGAAATDIG